MIRVVLPGHLQRLANVGREVILTVDPPITQRSVLDALEREYPMLRGTIRDHTTKKRRPFIRFFACERDLSHRTPDEPLPKEVASGTEPYLIVGAIAGGALDIAPPFTFGWEPSGLADQHRLRLDPRHRGIIYGSAWSRQEDTCMSGALTAIGFVAELREHQSDEERSKYSRYFKMGHGDYGEGDMFIGVRMGQVFTLAKAFIEMPIAEIEQLLESSIHEARAGAMSIMDKRARRKRTPTEFRAEMYDLYRRRIDRINNWDLVDLGAPYVVGGYLYERSREPLYEMARSHNLWERRTAIVATSYFIRQGQIDDTFDIAEILIDDGEDLIHKAVGGWLREAGKRDRHRLLRFLEEHAAAMPRTMLRYSMEHLEKETREYFRGKKQ